MNNDNDNDSDNDNDNDNDNDISNDNDNSNDKRYFRVQERVSQVTVADIRETILAEASNAMFGRQTNLAKFTTTDNPSATCATVDTAGWGGIDECTTQCASKRSVTRKAPHEGACQALCALAIDPCVRM